MAPRVPVPNPRDHRLAERDESVIRVVRGGAGSAGDVTGVERIVHVLVVICRPEVPGRPWVRCCSDWLAAPHATPSTRHVPSYTGRNDTVTLPGHGSRAWRAVLLECFSRRGSAAEPQEREEHPRSGG